MEFNLSKYLTENKLTHQSYMREEDDVLDVSPDVQNQPTINLDEPGSYVDEPEVDLGEPDDTMSDLDVDLGEPEDDFVQQEPEGEEDFEKEPSAKDIKEPKDTEDIHQKQAELDQLEAYKNDLLAKYNSNKLNIAQYKELVGDVPTKIKKLRDQIKKAMTVTLDDEEDEI